MVVAVVRVAVLTGALVLALLVAYGLGLDPWASSDEPLPVIELDGPQRAPSPASPPTSAPPPQLEIVPPPTVIPVSPPPSTAPRMTTPPSGPAAPREHPPDGDDDGDDDGDSDDDG